MTKVRINATISNLNYQHIVEFVESVKPLDPFCIMFMHLNYVTEEMAALHNSEFEEICQATSMGIGGTNPFKVDGKVLHQQIARVQSMLPAGQLLIQPDIRSEEQLDIYYHKPEIFLNRKNCLMPWQTMMIIPDGGVIVRNRCYHVVFGNIFQNSVSEIWNNPSYRVFRDTVKKWGSFPACSRCYGINH